MWLPNCSPLKVLRGVEYKNYHFKTRKSNQKAIAVMSRKPIPSNTSKTTLIHVQPRPESRESDFEVISMDEAEGGSRDDRNVQFDDVVIYSNPEGELPS